MSVHSLSFEPWFCPRTWGGSRLQTQLGKTLPVGSGPIGESWDISGHPLHVSRVAEGPWAGKCLNQLWQEQGRDWTAYLESAAPDRFPLLIKHLDCHAALSVQVHPDTQQAQQLGIDQVGKTEAWVVLHAAADSFLYAGWQAGVTRADVEQHLATGDIPQLLHRITPQVGESFVIPAGTVHALGGGLVLLEVQQCSDATLRLFDWNRPQNPAAPRPLHIAESLACIDWQRGPIFPTTPQPLDNPSPGSRSELLAETPFFQIERHHLNAATTSSRVWESSGRELSIWTPVAGQVTLHDPSTGPRRLSPGQLLMTLPQPAPLRWEIEQAETILLRITLPADEQGSN